MNKSMRTQTKSGALQIMIINDYIVTAEYRLAGLKLTVAKSLQT